MATPASPLLGQSTYFVVSRSRSSSAKRGSLDSDDQPHIIRENDDVELDFIRFGSVWKEAVARGAHCGGRTLHLREVALADLPQAVEDFDLPPQMWCCFAQRELGYNCCPLCRQVRFPMILFVLNRVVSREIV